MGAVHGVDQTLWYILGGSAVLLLGITVVMVYFVVQCRPKRESLAADGRDNTLLEILWTVLPTLIALSMLYLGWKVSSGPCWPG
ncbi:MAG: cytochrome c oxidase subunit II transmembrane domain-containing protein [Desulfopila sp.]